MNIIKFVFSLIIIIIICSINLFSQTECRVCYIGNAGFLIETNNKKILIDALFGGFKEDWCDSPDESVIKAIENAEPPFDKIDLIAVTHNHRDHFNAEIAIRHIKNNSLCKIICPFQADSVMRLFPGYKEIESNIIAITPNISRDTLAELEGISIRILRLKHASYYTKDENTSLSVDKHRYIEHIGFVINVDGISILHTGDAHPNNSGEFEEYDLINDRVDIAFFDRYIIGDIKKKKKGRWENMLNQKKLF